MSEVIIALEAFLIMILFALFIFSISAIIFILTVIYPEVDKKCTQIKKKCKSLLDVIWRKLRGN